MRKTVFIFRILPLVILLSLFSIFVNNVVKKQRQEDRLIYKNWHYTVGQIIKTGSRKSGEYAKLAFTVDGMSYMEEFDFRNPIIGNCYTVYYDSLDPGKMSVLNKAEQRLMADIDNIEISVRNVKIHNDTTPMGWHLIDYEYSFNNKTYNGNRYVKDQYFKNIRLDSLLAVVNINSPDASYLIWPIGPVLYCSKEKGKLIIYSEELK